jgi:hypothetical protein
VELVGKKTEKAPEFLLQSHAVSCI